MMTIQKDSAPRVLVAITPRKSADKLKSLWEQGKINSQYRLNASGTASREMINILGLGSSEKVITLSMMPRIMAEKILKKIDQELRMRAIDSGIAFTLPISGGSNQLLRLISHIMPEEIQKLTKEGSADVKEMKHALIAVFANQGYSEDIMAAARSAGATGGTVFHSRKIVDENAAKFWEFSVQEEKEIVLIVTSVDAKLDIMKVISEKCGLHSNAKGVVISLPVDSVIGLAE